MKRFLSLFGGYSADYLPFKTPADMARASSVIVAGKITGVIPGRIWYPGEVDESSTVAIQVKIEDVYHGKVSEDTVWVEIKSGSITAEKFDSYAPRDARVLLYLDPAIETGQGYGTIASTSELQSSVGSSNLWMPVNPQGFMIGRDHGGVALPIDLEIHHNDHLGEFVPPFSDD